MALPKLETPTYSLKVPSTGQTVNYRPYLVKEEKILLMAMESEDEQQMIRAIQDVVNACTNNTIDMDHIAMSDMEYIFTQLRAKSVGETSTIKVKCQHCEASNEIDVNLENVRVNVPEFDTKIVKLTGSVSVSLRYPSVDAMVQSQECDSKSDVHGDEVFDAKEQSYDDLKEFIESLNTQQFNQIREFIDTIPAATIDADFMCVSCGEHNQFEVRGLGNFFG